MDADATLALLKAILAGTVRLTGAACIGKHQLFDPLPGNGNQAHREQERARVARALACCAGCPAIRHCPSVTVLELKKTAA
jgi:hypothetical protein